MSDRADVAQERAVKDGHDWETLSAEMVNAYLHNADLAIEERSRPPVDEIDPKPIYSCDRCQDKAYIGEKPCSECNPVGLLAEEVHPKAGKPTLLIIPEAIAGKTMAETADVARDLIKASSGESITTFSEGEKARPLKPGEYVCGKCEGKIHREKSGLGKKHWDFRR